MAERTTNEADESNKVEIAQGGIHSMKVEKMTATKAEEKEENQKVLTETTEKKSLRVRIDDEQSRDSERIEERLNCVFNDAPLGFKRMENEGSTPKDAYPMPIAEIMIDAVTGAQVYIDDIVIRSKRKVDHIQQLKLSFEKMRKHVLKMNPLKCAFGVSAGEFPRVRRTLERH
ncbi:uncharacterized protein LOC109792606 [Cajanus cajan]|uniref:uncharacterized protein LOC109792606 n=1 Tax=Cajanus cajan TaxID=3821 RepID=UPI00098D92F9|nr:uncharacterized protein LOC109792606 [Cajanus cajan]